jgi:hypothetical protein
MHRDLNNRFQPNLANKAPAAWRVNVKRATVLMSIVGLALFGGVACSIGQPAAAPTDQAQAQNGAGPGGRQVMVTPAPELPTAKADVTGFLVKRADASLFVGTGFGNGQGGNGQGGNRGNGTRQPNANGGTRQPNANGGTRQPNANGGTPFAYSGPQTEVLVDSGTKYFKDISVVDFQTMQNGQGYQQKVQSVDTLDNLLTGDTTGGTVEVWGTQNGNQIEASVVVFRPRQARPTPTPATQ